MKKIYLLSALLLALLLSVGCQALRDIEQMAYLPTVPVSSPSEFTREQLLYDFDVLVMGISYSFPSADLVYRQNDFDIFEVAAELREVIAHDDFEVCVLNFYNLLREHFFAYIHPVGFLNFQGHASWSVSAHYRLNYHARQLYAHFGYQLQEHVVREDLYALAQQNAANFPYTVMSILQDGKIAYASFPLLVEPLFGLRAEAKMSAIDEFYAQLDGFEHLIIDFRGATDGCFISFMNLAIRPLLDSPIEATFYYFYKDSSINRNHRAMSFVGTIGDGMQLSKTFLEDGDNEFYSQMQGFFGHNMPSDDVLSDIRQFDVYFYRTHRFYPIPYTSNRYSAFDGKVWILTDFGNISNAQYLISFLEQAGVGTIVGETTGGAPFSPYFPNIYVPLPHTGIIMRYNPLYIVTADGRPLEYGTVPHHFNHPGMDALQTVLELIEEGNY